MPGNVQVIIDRPALHVFRGWAGPLGWSFSRLSRETVWRQKQLAHRRTGALQNSISANLRPQLMNGNLTFETGSKVKYALIHELGSKPHIITPKKAGGVLVFFWPKVGHVVAFKSVQHPGTRGYHYLTEGLEAAMRMWERGS
ncbi:MAG: hypothetical protein ACOYD1_07685 [Candidatus Nanopelagicales bacterium]